MPSASAKLEKQSSTESHDPIKHVLSMVEKKVRNLEKRKGKLDNYRMDFNNGKELNEDQMNAIKKYEQVVEMLDFSKDMQKSIQTIIQECAKQQKKAAKREQVERQQQEMQRIREILQLQDLLNNMGTDDVRQDFLTGTQGAVKLNQEDLDRLDELYKLLCPDRESAKEKFESLLNSAAEHFVGLLDGRNKELLSGAVTYKTVKELLGKINGCEYFSRGSAKDVTQDEEDHVAATDDATSKDLPVQEFTEMPQEAQQVESGSPFYPGEGPTYIAPQPPLPEVLHVQGNFNFLQDSQVDVESGRTVASYPPPTAVHMDPAVVAAQPMAGYHTAAAGQEEFDPVGPIPTQTFTNQNYALMGIAPNSYVAPQPMGIPVPAQNLATQSGVVAQQEQESTFLSIDEFQENMVSSNSTHAQSGNAQYVSSDDNEEGADAGFTQQGARGGFRGGRGNRGPRPSNGYSRGSRGGFSNGRGGGYQNSNNNNNYYGGRDNYNSPSQQRRGGSSARGTSRGAAASRGGAARSRGNFRSQQ